MSKISTVYDKLLSVIPTLFPNKTRIPNADSLEDNNITFLRDGWGLRIDNQAYTQSEFHIMETMRVFTVIFTEEVIKTDSQTTQVDAGKKSIMEDIYTIQKDFFNIDRLEIPDDVSRVELGGTSAILEIKSGRSNFVYVEVYFNIHVRETL